LQNYVPETFNCPLRATGEFFGAAKQPIKKNEKINVDICLRYFIISGNIFIEIVILFD